MDFLGEIVETDGFPTVDSSEFVGQDFVHLYQGVPIKATVCEVMSDDKRKIKLSQEGDVSITQDELMNALNRKDNNCDQYWGYQKLTGQQKEPEIKAFC